MNYDSALCTVEWIIYVIFTGTMFNVSSAVYVIYVTGPMHSRRTAPNPESCSSLNNSFRSQEVGTLFLHRKWVHFSFTWNGRLPFSLTGSVTDSTLREEKASGQTPLMCRYVCVWTQTPNAKTQTSSNQRQTKNRNWISRYKLAKVLVLLGIWLTTLKLVRLHLHSRSKMNGILLGVNQMGDSRSYIRHLSHIHVDISI
jgi:hypothetical protein